MFSISVAQNIHSSKNDSGAQMLLSIQNVIFNFLLLHFIQENAFNAVMLRFKNFDKLRLSKVNSDGSHIYVYINMNMPPLLE
jgi:hypothetical protein